MLLLDFIASGVVLGLAGLLATCCLMVPAINAAMRDHGAHITTKESWISLGFFVLAVVFAALGIWGFLHINSGGLHPYY